MSFTLLYGPDAKPQSPPPAATVPATGIALNGWKIYIRKSSLSASTEIDAYHASAGVKPPEMVFLSNYLAIEHAASGLRFVFTARDALARCKQAKSAAHTGSVSGVAVAVAATGTTNTANTASAASANSQSATTKPDTKTDTKSAAADASNSSSIKVKAATAWTNKNMSEVDLGYDWTYTTDYRGSIGSISTSGSDGASASASGGGGGPVGYSQPQSPTAAEIDIEMLKRQDIPILWSIPDGGELVLYEDELHDNGISRLSVKCRVMPTGFLVLQRFWLRVDGVMIRIRDTRVFHSFAKPHQLLIRDYSEREATFEQLRRSGMPDTPKYYADPNQFAQFIPNVPKSAIKELIAIATLPPTTPAPTATTLTTAAATATATTTTTTTTTTASK